MFSCPAHIKRSAFDGRNEGRKKKKSCQNEKKGKKGRKSPEWGYEDSSKAVGMDVRRLRKRKILTDDTGKTKGKGKKKKKKDYELQSG